MGNSSIYSGDGIMRGPGELSKDIMNAVNEWNQMNYVQYKFEQSEVLRWVKK